MFVPNVTYNEWIAFKRKLECVSGSDDLPTVMQKCVELEKYCNGNEEDIVALEENVTLLTKENTTLSNDKEYLKRMLVVSAKEIEDLEQENSDIKEATEALLEAIKELEDELHQNALDL